MSNIDSAVVQVEEITAEMRRHANSYGLPYQHTAALRQACALLEPPIGLSTYYRYRVLYSEYHFGEVRNWLIYLTSFETGRRKNDSAEA
jgi:hypothetical protein